MTTILQTTSPEPAANQAEAAQVEAPLPTALERAGQKVQIFGAEAQLTLEEAAAVLDVSPSTFERIGIPCVPWTPRGRRWRYGAIVEHAQDLERESISHSR
jgi:hypothetical protein